jgi:NAD(P)-dependent dehydrogenase (short-subunit alcohol dehydrogenase family)
MLYSMPDLSGQVAVVTGASRGVGRAIARVLGQGGATGYVTGRSVRGEPTVAEYPNRAVEVIAGELGEREIAILALSPGWMYVERMTGLTEHQLAQTESPEYIGRAVAALAADPAVMRRTGQVLTVGDLAREYGFTDLDGRQPIAYPIVR